MLAAAQMDQNGPIPAALIGIVLVTLAVGLLGWQVASRLARSPARSFWPDRYIPTGSDLSLIGELAAPGGGDRGAWSHRELAGGNGSGQDDPGASLKANQELMAQGSRQYVIPFFGASLLPPRSPG